MQRPEWSVVKNWQQRGEEVASEGEEGGIAKKKKNSDRWKASFDKEQRPVEVGI